jgi:UDP-N-acetylglucosamine--N-acetylmuramyl-(pentapeptide) pyrophosphoryl-undecaprenol N-acetylglucosamine transferase
VPAAGFALEPIAIGGLNRVGLTQRLRTLWQLPISTLRVAWWMVKNRPGAVFSMGGYVAGPVVLAARLCRIPCVLMEPNALPGFTNRKMASWTARALVNFQETLQYFPRAELTGVPVRSEFFDIPPRTPGEKLGLLVTGGSQGSRTLNEAGRASWPLFRDAGLPLRIVHQAGRGKAAELEQPFRESGLEGEVVEFISDMPRAFSEADLVVCRAGASTVSELAAAGRPSVLVPFPYAADNHQQRNAEAMEQAGAARLVLDAEMTGERLFREVTDLARLPETLREMGVRAREMAHRHAATRAAEVLEEVAVSS